MVSNENSRKIPDFIVIGAMRAGTTTLYELLRASGQVVVPDMKETDYFMTDEHFRLGPEWFRARYPNIDRPVGDISPNYLKRETFPGVAQRIYETNPDARLIMLVRDPVERAVSQYKHMLTLRPDIDPEFDPGSAAGQHAIDVSRYAFQLEPYLEYWSVKDILIVDFDSLVEQPFDVLDETLQFIGLEPDYQISVDIDANSSASVTRLPGWWGVLRDSKLGRAIRARAPRSMISRAKKLFASKQSGTAPAPIPEQMIDDIRSAVKDDAEKFCQLVGQRFPKWGDYTSSSFTK